MKIVIQPKTYEQLDEVINNLIKHSIPFGWWPDTTAEPQPSKTVLPNDTVPSGAKPRKKHYKKYVAKGGKKAADFILEHMIAHPGRFVASDFKEILRAHGFAGSTANPVCSDLFAAGKLGRMDATQPFVYWLKGAQ